MTELPNPLLAFIESPVIKNDPVLKSLLLEADQVPDAGLLVHNFIRQTNEYVGLYLETLTGLYQADIIKGGLLMMMQTCSPEVIHQLSAGMGSHVIQAKSEGFDPRSFCFHSYSWIINHTGKFKVPVNSMGVILTYTIQCDLEFGVGFLLKAEADHNKIETCKSILKKIKERHNEIYLHPIRKVSTTPYPLNYFINVDNISHREREVLGMLAKGLSTKEIGDHLCLSANTIETQRKHLLEKFGSKNTAELIKKASKVFWLE